MNHESGGPGFQHRQGEVRKYHLSNQTNIIKEIVMRIIEIMITIIEIMMRITEIMITIIDL